MLWITLDKTDFGRENSHFMLFGLEIVREKRERRESFQVLLSLILTVPSVGIRRAKSESSSTQRRLWVGMEKEGFHRRSK